MMQLVICLICAVLIGVDQLTKWLAVMYLEGADPFVVINGIVSFTYRENTGAAWSILSGQTWLLIVGTSVLLLALIGVLLSGMFKNSKGAIVGGIMVVSGGVGNLIDRVWHGYVIDFIRVDFINFPVFNFADCLIVIGALWLFVYFVFIYAEPGESIRLKKGAHTANDDDQTDDGNDGNAT